MPKLLLTIFLLFLAVSVLFGQKSETFGKLIPYQEWLKNEIEKNRGITGESFKPRKIKANFQLFQNNTNALIVQIQISNKDLVYVDNDGIMIARMRYFIRIKSQDNKFDHAFEDIKVIDEISLNKMNERFYLPKEPVSYQVAFKIPKGKYTAYLFTDNRTSNEAKKKIKFEIK